MDANKFGSSFMAWWISLQLEWRIADNRLFNYKAPKDEDWSLLHKSGTAGLYTVMRQQLSIPCIAPKNNTQNQQRV